LVAFDHRDTALMATSVNAPKTVILMQSLSPRFTVPQSDF